MKRLLIFLMFLYATVGIYAQSDMSEYSLREVYKKGDASVIRATKENEEKFVIKIAQSRYKTMFVALGTRGDAIITLQSILNRPVEYQTLFRLDNPSNNLAGFFLKQSNASTLVRFYEGLNLNDFGVISLRDLKKIEKWLKHYSPK